MKDYSKMNLEELEAERQALSNRMDEAIAKFKGGIREISALIDRKAAEEKVKAMPEAEKKALARALKS